MPGLAREWSVSDDGLAWTFTLRDDVLFHDGSPLRSEDVVASIERIVDPYWASPRASDFDMVRRVEAVDPLTVVFHLERPFSPLLSTLAFGTHAIVRERTEGGDAIGLVGTGPFRLTGYVPQGSLVLERHDAYWKVDDDGVRLPYLDAIDARIMLDDSARIIALRSGEIDFVDLVPAPDTEVLRADPEITVVGGPGNNLRVLAFNVRAPPFDDVRVRRAIAYAIDEEEIVRTALFGEAVASRGTVIPHYTEFGISTNPYLGKRLDEARLLLEQAGLGDGFSMTLYATSAPSVLRAPAELIQSDLAEIGIDVEIVVEHFSLWVARNLASDFGAIVTGVPNEIDPDANLFAYFHTEGSLNIYQASNAEIDVLLERGRRVVNPNERYAIYAEVQELLLDEAYAAFLFHSTQYEAMRHHVRGFEHSMLPVDEGSQEHLARGLAGS